MATDAPEPTDPDDNRASTAAPDHCGTHDSEHGTFADGTHHRSKLGQIGLALAICVAAVLVALVALRQVGLISGPAEEVATPSVQIRFNALGGSTPPFINVYRGAGTSDADRTPTGTFRDGELARATCQTEGRGISSNTDAGEEHRESTTWVRVAPESGDPMFASVTYADVDPGALASLPKCE